MPNSEVGVPAQHNSQGSKMTHPNKSRNLFWRVSIQGERIARHIHTTQRHKGATIICRRSLFTFQLFNSNNLKEVYLEIDLSPSGLMYTNLFCKINWRYLFNILYYYLCILYKMNIFNQTNQECKSLPTSIFLSQNFLIGFRCKPTG